MLMTTQILVVLLIGRSTLSLQHDHIWVVTRHHYGNSAVISQTQFAGEPVVAYQNVSCFHRLQAFWHSVENVMKLSSVSRRSHYV